MARKQLHRGFKNANLSNTLLLTSRDEHRASGQFMAGERGNDGVDTISINLYGDAFHNQFERKNDAKQAFFSEQNAFHAFQRTTPDAHSLPDYEIRMRFTLDERKRGTQRLNVRLRQRHRSPCSADQR